MRNENEMMALILGIARDDERIRGVVMNGSRANPNAAPDIFQDYDIIYVVTEIGPFINDPAWIDRFGELMIMQKPDEMEDSSAADGDPYHFLMQFADGNRIDLTIFPAHRLDEMEEDSLTILLLDKDGIFGSPPPTSDKGYLPQPPSEKKFADCCNEFWWVSTYVAKGLWREEIIYAKAMQDQVIRPQLHNMLAWYIGIKTGFQGNPGKFGKYFERYLEPELWDLLQATYADADIGRTWDALEKMGSLFRLTSRHVAEHFNFSYPSAEDENVTAHLKHVRTLPKDATEIY